MLDVDDNGNINYQSPNHVEVSAAENQFKDLEEFYHKIRGW